MRSAFTVSASARARFMISSRWRPASRISSWCWARRRCASSFAFCAEPTASWMPFSRSSIMARRGFQPSLVSTKAKIRNSTTVHRVSPNSRSVKPPAARAAGVETRFTL
jgi:hypothetical protein